jgi:hypothetical protein
MFGFNFMSGFSNATRIFVRRILPPASRCEEAGLPLQPTGSIRPLRGVWSRPCTERDRGHHRASQRGLPATPGPACGWPPQEQQLSNLGNSLTIHAKTSANHDERIIPSQCGSIW